MKRIIFILCAIVALTSCSSIEKDIANEFKIYAKENNLKSFDKVLSVEFSDSIYNCVYEQKLQSMRNYGIAKRPDAVKCIDSMLDYYRSKFMRKDYKILVYKATVQFKNGNRTISEDIIVVDDGFQYKIQGAGQDDIPNMFWKYNDFANIFMTFIDLSYENNWDKDVMFDIVEDVFRKNL